MGNVINFFQEVTQPNPLVKVILPILAQLGLGGGVGFGTGFFLKKLGKFAAVVFAVVFIFIQVLIHFGYIPGVDWARLGKDITGAMNANLLNYIWNLKLKI